MLAVGIPLAMPGALRAQGPRISPIAATPSARQHDSPIAATSSAGQQSGREMRDQWDVYEFGRYVTLGGAIGAVGGLVYGLAFERDWPRGPVRDLAIVGHSVRGFAVGIVGGAVVYVAKVAISRR